MTRRRRPFTPLLFDGRWVIERSVAPPARQITAYIAGILSLRRHRHA